LELLAVEQATQHAMQMTMAMGQTISSTTPAMVTPTMIPTRLVVEESTTGGNTKTSTAKRLLKLFHKCISILSIKNACGSRLALCHRKYDRCGILQRVKIRSHISSKMFMQDQ